MSAASTHNRNHSESKFRKFFANDQHPWYKIATISPYHQDYNKTLLGKCRYITVSILSLYQFNRYIDQKYNHINVSDYNFVL